MIHQFTGFLSCEMDRFDLELSAITKVLSLSSQLWTTIGVPLDNNPLEWINMTDDKLPKGIVTSRIEGLRS